MKHPPSRRIRVGERVMLEQSDSDSLTAIITTSGGVMRLPIDLKQLERWLIRQLRAAIPV